ncbi:MAG: winged helix-turn-helix transcriptional regulator [Candidatus Kariarchaeaceae archaeon]|jgi:DNA-binding HxlR family transcriptional regulator
MKKWTLLILHNLLLGYHHFSDFLQLNPDLSAKVLSARLKELQRLELVNKVIANLTPVQVEYHLSSKGKKIKPIVQAAIFYALDAFPEEIYNSKTPDRKAVLDQFGC